jgi:hypothetical protein
MSKLAIRFTFMFAFVLLGASYSFAANCGTGKILLQDSFATLSPVWGITPGPDVKPGPNGLKVSIKENSNILGLNQSGLFDDYEVCLTVKATSKCTDPDKCEASPYFGVVFWGVDRKNVYSCDVTPAYGTYSIWRLQNNKFVNPVPWTDVDKKAVAKMTQDFVDISVAVKGNHLTCKVNGVVTAEIDGLPPDGGSLFGFEVGTPSSNTEGSDLVFKKIELRELQ